MLADTGDRLRAAIATKRFELAPGGQGARRLLDAAHGGGERTLVSCARHGQLTWSPLLNHGAGTKTRRCSAVERCVFKALHSFTCRPTSRRNVGLLAKQSSSVECT